MYQTGGEYKVGYRLLIGGPVKVVFVDAFKLNDASCVLYSEY